MRLLLPEGQTLHYDSGSDKLSDAAQLALLAAALLSTPALRIVVEGHADSQLKQRSSVDALGVCPLQILHDAVVCRVTYVLGR